MGKDDRDRLSIDLRGIRERIEALQARNELMREMKLSQVLRYVILQGLEALESQFGRPPAIADLVAQWDLKKLATESKLPLKALKEIKLGRQPTIEELLDLTTVLVKSDGSPWSIYELRAIRDRTFPADTPPNEKTP